MQIKQKYSEAVNEKSALTIKLENALRKIDDSQHLLKQMQQQITSLTDEKTNLDIAVKAEKKKFDDANSRLLEIKQKYSDVVNEKSALKSKCEIAFKKNNNSDELLKQTQQQITLLINEKSDLVATVEAEKKKFDDANGQLTELKKKYAEAIDAKPTMAPKCEIDQKIDEPSSSKKRVSVDKDLYGAKLAKIGNDARTPRKSAQMKPTPKSTKQTPQKNKDYEVESIIDHKIENEQYYYLVHWKHFSSNHDSWVPKKDLSCPKILKMYHEQKKLATGDSE